MLLWLSEQLAAVNPDFNVFAYLTLRTILAALTALVLSLLLGPWVIRRLTVAQIGQPIRAEGPQSHLSKAGTPTMGGVLILVAMAVAVLLWGDLANRHVWIVLLVTLAFGVIGAADDYRKQVLDHSRGVPARWKYLAESIVALAVACFLFFTAADPAETVLLLPFFKNIMVPLGAGFIVLAYLVIVGAGNAVNLTDGLDGLAVMPAVLIAAALGVFAYATGNAIFADYLQIPYIPGVGEVAVVCGALAGAGLGFLWFNTYPAEIFMGDVGALAVGAALGTIAVVVRQELVFMLMAGVFVVETLSVMIQVASFKTTGRRVFRMAPIHHHFELKGWPEPRVIVRFWIVSVMLVLMGLATLKIR